jgi:post-segregation antitoxin (ccd killing protein)
MKKNVNITMDIELYKNLINTELGISGSISEALYNYAELRIDNEKLKRANSQLQELLLKAHDNGNENAQD